MKSRGTFIFTIIFFTIMMVESIAAATINDIVVKRKEGTTYVTIICDGEPEYTYQLNENPPAVDITVQAKLAFGKKKFTIERGGITTISTRQDKNDQSYITIKFWQKTACEFSSDTGQIVITLKPEDMISLFRQKIDTTATILRMQQTEYNDYIYYENDTVVIKADYTLFYAELSQQHKFLKRYLNLKKDILRKIQTLHLQRQPSVNLYSLLYSNRWLSDTSTHLEKSYMQGELDKDINMHGEALRTLADLIDQGRVAIIRKADNGYVDSVLCRHEMIVDDPNRLSKGRKYYFLDGKCFYNVEDNFIEID